MTQAVTTPIRDLVPQKTIDYDASGHLDVGTILAIRDLLQEATTTLTEWRLDRPANVLLLQWTAHTWI